MLKNNNIRQMAHPNLPAVVYGLLDDLTPGHFVINDYTITIKEKHDHGPDRELQKWATFCKSRSQEILCNFSRKIIQFPVIANCRNKPISGNHDIKKTSQILKKNNTISRDRKLQK